MAEGMMKMMKKNLNFQKNQQKLQRREFSSGGIVYRKVTSSDGHVSFEWLITKATPSELFPNNYWRLPKGWIDDAGDGIPGALASGKRKATEKELCDAALREVREEAGVDAKVIEKLGTIHYTYSFEGVRVLKFVTFYLMEWLADLPEGFGFETSEIKWCSKDQAERELKSNLERDTLRKANLVVLNKIIK
jgi:8-oxo-dGTP pyrophosphatase MutT (NUDIX family)